VGQETYTVVLFGEDNLKSGEIEMNRSDCCGSPKNSPKPGKRQLPIPDRPTTFNEPHHFTAYLYRLPKSRGRMFDQISNAE
jgi:hypothetical protein